MTYLCDHTNEVLAKIRVLLSLALQNIYQSKFHHEPPPSFSRVRDYTFLPHLLKVNKPAKHMTIAEIAESTLGQIGDNRISKLTQSIDELRQAENYDHQKQKIIDRCKASHVPPTVETALLGAASCDAKPNEVVAPNKTDRATDTDNTLQSPTNPSGAPPRGGQPQGGATESNNTDPCVLTDILEHIARRLLDYRRDHNKEQPTSLRQVTSWNVGGWTQPGRPGDDKLKAIKAYIKKGPVAIQETHWTHEQATKLHSLIPGSHIVATAASIKNTHPSGGTAVILPIGYEVITHQTVLPGQILAVQARIKGAKIRIVTIYLHPDNVHESLQALIKYLRNIDLREWTILAGDFNRADQQCSKAWQQLTEEYGFTDGHPTLPTFRTTTGETCLDRILLPTAFLQNLQLRSSTSVRWIGEKLRHGAVTLRLKHRSTVPPDPKLPRHHTIPPYIFRPGMEGPVHNKLAKEAIQDLERRIMQEPNHAQTTESMTNLFWAWWRTLTPEHKRPQANIAALIHTSLKQKGTHVVLRASTYETLTGTSGIAVENTRTTEGAYEVARTELYRALEVLDAQAITYRLAPKNTPEITGDRSNATQFWQRMRELKTTQGTYNGPIYRANGQRCNTVHDLDQAMIDTRAFWEEKPPETEPAWLPILSEYQAGNCRFPTFPDLTIARIQNHLLHTKESAPGLDGIPYAAWRLNPEATGHAIYKLFTRITRAQEEPPSQVLVWIPKAAAGPTGDHFRPLGMPNTSHRILDGALSSLVVAHCSQHLHPSQSMLNHFREPQKAVLSIQQELDDTGPKAALFIDMAKAFEKVNPHWAVDVMLARGCPVWLVQYAMYLFTGRRVLHKVGGQLLPPRIIRQGVDMGRAFSVFMFCFAMDPVYWHLNKIPDVVNVKGYVDDCTAVGHAGRDLAWLMPVRKLFTDLHTAGFQIIEHSCWLAIAARPSEYGYPLAGHRKYLPTSIEQELNQASGCPTCLSALLKHKPCEAESWPKVIIARNDYYYTLSSEQARQLAEQSIIHQQRHTVFSLAVSKCKCKAKTAILTNIPPQAPHIITLEQSTFGLASLVSDTIQLGLVVRGRFRPTTNLSQDPKPGPPDYFGRTTYTEHGGELEWIATGGPKLLAELFSKACTASTALLNTLRLTTVSIRQRAIFYGTYCLSKFTYAGSYAVVTAKDISQMQVQVARAVLRRPWIKASHLAGTLRALKIAPMQDPEIALACAAIGLLERRGKEDDELCAFLQQKDTNFEGDRQFDTAIVYLKRYLPTLQSTDIQTIQHIIRSTSFSQRQRPVPLTQPGRRTGLVKHFKLAMKNSREAQAIEHLRSRTTTTWSSAPSFDWLRALTNLHPRLCGPIPRYALLRWSIGGESDGAFWTRFHKLGPCVCGCGKLADSYPQGLTQAPLAEHHFTDYAPLVFHLHSDYDQIAQSILPLATYTALREEEPSEAAKAYPKVYYQTSTNGPLAHSSTPCVLCGKGDNCVDHWMRHCIILPITLALLIGKQANGGIERIAREGQHGLALATHLVFHLRRTIHEKGGLSEVPPSHPEPNSPPVIRTICEEIAGAVVASLATETILHFGITYQPLPAPGCTRLIQSAVTRLSPLHLAGQLHPSLAITALCELPVGATVLITDQGDTRYSLLHQHSKAPHVVPNIRYDYYPCRCGSIHVAAKTTRRVQQGEMLLYNDQSNMTTRVLLVQFDGSYKPRLKRGGAGVAAFLVEQQCMKLLDWQAVAIANCPDNIHAETIACEQATLLAAEWYAKLAPEGSITVIIQGDILPLIQFLNYTARLRYAGVQQHLLNIKQTALHQLPNHSFTYLPREGNAIADYLAGAGAEFLPPAAGVDTYSQSPLPPALLNKANLYHLPLQQSLTLNEHPHIHYPPLAAYLQQHPTHRQDLVRYLAKYRAHACAAGLKITYWRTSSDGKGRYYAQGPAAQRLPKELRTLLYGRTHTEIDVIGAFYEIIRRTALTLATTEDAERPPPIPDVEQARHIIEQELLRQRPQGHATPVAKRLLHIAINATITTAAKYITEQHYTYTQPISALIAIVHQVATLVCKYLQDNPTTHRLHSTARNSHFFHLEGIEATYISHIIDGLQQAQPRSSIVLLHDGLLVSPLPSQSTLARLNEESLSLAGLRNDDYPFLRITNLQDLYTQIVRQLPPITEQDLESLRAAIATVNLTHLRQPTTAPQALGGSTIPPPTTAATLHAYFRRIGRRQTSHN